MAARQNRAIDFTIQNGFTLQFSSDRITEAGKTSVDIAAPRNETAFLIDVRECSESIVLQFEDVVGMVECALSKDWLCWCELENRQRRLSV